MTVYDKEIDFVNLRAETYAGESYTPFYFLYVCSLTHDLARP